MDSGASSHMTQDKELLSDYREFENPEKVGLGDGHVVNAVGIGKVRVNMLFKMSKSKESVIHEVLYVPKLTCNLFSVRAAAERGNIVKFGQFRCWIRDRKEKLCGMGLLTGKMYHLNCEPAISQEQPSVATASKETNEMDLWRQRLGHVNGQ